MRGASKKVVGGAVADKKVVEVAAVTKKAPEVMRFEVEETANNDEQDAAHK